MIKLSASGKGASGAFLAILVFSVSLVFGPEALAYRFGEPAVRAIGPEEIVFDWSTTACEQNDIPDSPARAFRDAAGRVQLIASHAVVRRELGPDLNSVQHQCAVVMNSHGSTDPALYNDREWLSATYTTDGQTIYGLSHQEYEGWNYDPNCAQWRGTFEQAKCWMNSVNLVKSVNGGTSYTHAAAPSHLVASAPYRYVSGAGPLGVFDPSNIVQKDGHYYATVRVEAHGAQQRGICLIRTANLADPSSWRAWDGSGFGVRFINPYLEPDEPPSAHVCTVLSPGQLPYGNSSLTYNSYLQKYVFLAVSEKLDPSSDQQVGGFYYSVSDDLIHWSEQQLLMEGVLTWRHQCGDPDPVLYPSLLDPTAPDRNFETTGRRPYLYFTRFNYEYYDADTCWMTLDRDLVRIPIEFTEPDPPNEPPTASFTVSPNPALTDVPVTFDGSGSSDPDGSITNYRWDLDGDGTFETDTGTTATTSSSYPSAATITVKLRVTDNSGASSDASSALTIEDPPETTITSGPSGPTNSTAATFAFASDTGTTFQCRLDGPGASQGSYSACAGSSAYSDLAEGAYTFFVFATDSDGTPDPTPATASFTVDTTAPATSILERPVSPTNETAATFTFSADEAGATFECRLTGEVDFTPCTSPVTYPGLVDGAYTFRVRAVDLAGNLDAGTRYDWTIETSLPQTTIDSGPSDPTNSTSATFTFSSNEPGSTFECQLDGATTWTPCGPAESVTGLSEGQHTLSVRARDTADNVDPVPATRTWRVDLTAPETTIDSGPSGTVIGTGVTFSFSSNEDLSSFECMLDAGSWDPCTSPKSYAGLAEGLHTFAVRGRDQAGNLDPTDASRSWAVDITPPETSITVGPPPTTGSGSATFEFSSTEAGSRFACRLDAGDWTDCVSPLTYAGLSPGSHVFHVQATDQSENTDPSPATWTWAIPQAAPPPVSELTKPPAPLVHLDSDPPVLRVLAGRTQRVHKRRGVVVEVGCPAEACTATARGTVSVAGAARSFKLESARAQVPKGGSRKLRLGFSRSAFRTLTRAANRHGKASAKVIVGVTDAAGNTTTKLVRVRLASANRRFAPRSPRHELRGSY